MALAIAVVLGLSTAAASAVAPPSGPLPSGEAAACQRPSATQPATARGDAPDNATVVHFVIPPTTWLDVVAGDVVRARTNTGCPPHAEDVMVVGTRPATRAERSQAIRAFGSGDWTVHGEWHEVT